MFSGLAFAGVWVFGVSGLGILSAFVDLDWLSLGVDLVGVCFGFVVFLLWFRFGLVVWVSVMLVLWVWFDALSFLVGLVVSTLTFRFWFFCWTCWCFWVFCALWVCLCWLVGFVGFCYYLTFGLFDCFVLVFWWLIIVVDVLVSDIGMCLLLFRLIVLSW